MTSAPFDAYRDVVRPEWIDDNGHLNMGYYVVVFDYATDAWLDYLGLSPSERVRMGVATFTLESPLPVCSPASPDQLARPSDAVSSSTRTPSTTRRRTRTMPESRGRSAI